ncbi:MAG: sensor histidine kinase [Candidatus Nomurabacteria bacterium]|jgi:signal transduction histidine kinase|nr:sensor histidine kinase [Candidatus Nomurabacteria bacterium]
MKLWDFLHDRLAFVTINLVGAGFSAVLLYAVNASLYFALFIPSIFIFSGCIALAIDYVGKNHYYKRVRNTLRRLDEKRFLLEVIDRPETLEGKIWYDILRTTTKSMNDAVARNDFDSKAYREYIELWVHEVKTPLAGLKLALENSKNKELLVEADRIERLAERALYYARSGSVEEDYLIHRIKLSDIVNTALKSSARYLIQQKVSIEIGNLSNTALADPKWLVFILRQLIENSVKYGAKKLVFSSRRKNKQVLLTLNDNGVGIPPEDLGRVFDKGFTGINGRRFGKSTGLGLYMCKNLCRRLGLSLRLSSQVNKGTTVEITFPISTITLPTRTKE